MPEQWATAPDGTRLWIEITGSGAPILFLHEFAGTAESWAPQRDAFCGRYRCIAYNARGYPPSDVPNTPTAYSQLHAVTDALAVLDELDVPAAHIVGLSMGGFTALHLALDHPARCLSVTIAGSGYGAAPEDREQFRAESQAAADAFAHDTAAAAKRYARGPTRVQYRMKNPHGWRTFADQLATHDPVGSTLTLRGIQGLRPSPFDFQDRLDGIITPTLLLVGDEDDGCLETHLLLKRRIRTSALAILPRTGHTINLEESATFNALLDRFLCLVTLGQWTAREPTSQGRGLVGMQNPGRVRKSFGG
ncbi:alpha/beta fold hydrolase [Streptomyces spiralis]|uniref:alpha/beta fold hydrolase n=1 Tax=Streptomyces spiralis TaxID=66376 RepID=UPI0036923F25